MIRRWWRRFKHKHGRDMILKRIGMFYWGKEDLIFSEHGCYSFECPYCNVLIRFPWQWHNLARANMQRHLKAKHL
jgi:hypothetical protein